MSSDDRTRTRLDEDLVPEYLDAEHLGREPVLDALLGAVRRGGETIFVIGPPGCGRRLLVLEAVRHLDAEDDHRSVWLSGTTAPDGQLAVLAARVGLVSRSAPHATKVLVGRETFRRLAPAIAVVVGGARETLAALESACGEAAAVVGVCDHADGDRLIAIPPLSMDRVRAVVKTVAGRDPSSVPDLGGLDALVHAIGGHLGTADIVGRLVTHAASEQDEPYRGVAATLGLRCDGSSNAPRHAPDSGSATTLASALRVARDVLSEDARTTLDIVVWLADAGIGTEFLAALLSWDTARVSHALAECERLGLWERPDIGGGDRRRGRVPPSVRVTLRSLIGEPDPGRLAEVGGRAFDWTREHRRRSESFTRVERELAHVEALAGLAASASPARAIELSWLLGAAEYQRGCYETAREILRAVADRAHHDRHVRGEMLTDLAASQARLGAMTDAIATDLDALALRREVLGDAHPDVGRTMHAIGLSHAELGRSTEALAWLGEAEARLRAAGEEARTDLAMCLSDLGVTHADRGDFAEAARRHREALRLVPASADSASDLIRTRLLASAGGTHIRAGETARGERLLVRALALLAERLGAPSVEHARLLVSQAEILRATGRATRAVRTARAAVIELGAALSPAHLLVTGARIQLARALLAADRAHEAIEMADAAYTTRRRLLGLEHPDTVDAGQVLAEVLCASGDAPRARDVVTPLLPLVANRAQREVLARFADPSERSHRPRGGST